MTSRIPVRPHRPLLTIAALHTVAALLCAAGLLLDDRQVAGEPVWAKPLRFAVSIAVYALTLAWLLSLLPGRQRVARGAATAVATALGFEQALVVFQAARGQRSHFNITTRFDADLTLVMAAGIGVLWLGTAVVAVTLLRARLLDRAQALAVRAGLLVALAGMLVGALMIPPNADQKQAMHAGTGTASGAHTVGAPDGGPGLPLTGWSTVAGDLRVGHFVGIHALQALPLLALSLTLLGRRYPWLGAGRRARLVLVGAGLYAGFTALLTWQALRGQSVVHPDAPTLAVAAALLGAGVTAGAVGAAGAGPAAPSARAAATASPAP